MIAVYAPTLANGYISDDLVYIEGIQRLASLAGLRDIWLHIGAIPQYYPLLHTAFWLEYRVWGLAPMCSQMSRRPASDASLWIPSM